MSDETPVRRRGRPRRSGADEKILSVAQRILKQTGYRDFSVDAVHARTGIAKTTIYRRWPTKAALAAAAIAPMPDDVGDLHDIVRELCDVLNLIAAPDADADALDVLRAVVEPRRNLLVQTLTDKHESEAEMTADMIVGALIGRRLFAGKPLSAECGVAILARLTRSSS
jgi:AcrR family transcriptional regulator